MNDAVDLSPSFCSRCSFLKTKMLFSLCSRRQLQTPVILNVFNWNGAFKQCGPGLSQEWSKARQARFREVSLCDDTKGHRRLSEANDNSQVLAPMRRVQQQHIQFSQGAANRALNMQFSFWFLPGCCSGVWDRKNKQIMKVYMEPLTRSHPSIKACH